MYRVIPTGRFRKDLKTLQKRQKNMRKLERIIDSVSLGEPLDAKHQLHKLSGDWDGAWECHIEPDWLLIYRIIDRELYLMRTGTHSDLFRK